MKIKLALLVSLALLAAAPFPVSAARMDAAPNAASDCSDMALRVALANARAEMNALLPGSNGDAAALEAAMNSDSRFNERAKTAFGSADRVKTEYSARAGCVVTVSVN